MILIVILFLLALVAIQYFSFRKGIFFGSARDYLARNAENLPSADNVFGVGRLRPTAFFGEPSYLGWVTTYLLALVLLLRERVRNLQISLSLVGCILITFFTNSALGTSSVTLLLVGAVLRERKVSFSKKDSTLLLNMSRLIFFSCLIYVGFYRFVANSFSPQSFEGRIYNAFVRLPAYLLEYPFGFPPRQLLAGFEFQNVRIGNQLNNGITYLSYSYGAFGLIICAILIFKFFRSRSIYFNVFLIASIFQNGSFLDLDKVSLLFVLFLIDREMSNLITLSKSKNLKISPKQKNRPKVW
jgi:hypothetical protein